MTSFPAIARKLGSVQRLVVFLVYPNIVLLDLVGPLQVFTHALDQTDRSHGYDTAVVSLEGGQIGTNTLVSIDTEPLSDYAGRDIHTLVIVGGDGAYDSMYDSRLVDAVNCLAASAGRICAVCNGALILAAAGLLDGRRAVTHWEDCEQLAKEFPEVTVERDPIFIKDGPIWTSAGITAGMDLALAITSEDLGRPASLEMARSMVTPMVRAGGQSQFSPMLIRQSRDATGRFDGLHHWIADNLTADLRVDDLADQIGMSPRNFARRYASEMKTTPAKAVEAIRVDVARGLLESTDHSVKDIANRCGFKDDERMRRAFVRHLKTSPSGYRMRFQAPADTP